MNNFIPAMHNHPHQWREPEKFIPERFDPESEYFLTPDGKPRNPNVYAPFSHGIRNCPGSTLALLELKVLFITFLLKLKVTFPDSHKKNDQLYFRIFSHSDVTV